MKKFVVFSLAIVSLAAYSDSKYNDKYFKDRGSEKANFKFDDYSSKVVKKVLKTFVTDKKNSKKDRAFAKITSGKRNELFVNNLFDTGLDFNSNENCDELMKRIHRTPQGRCYFHHYKEHNFSKEDKYLADEVMIGSRGQRFGRNINPKSTNKSISQIELMDPNPLEISKKLLTRNDGKTKEAKVINVLATAWLQAMNHDWFSHGKNSKKKYHHVPSYASHPHFKDGMRIPSTVDESSMNRNSRDSKYDYNSRNTVTHWWDASQIYGSDKETINKVRGKYVNGKKIGLLKNGKIAVDSFNKKLLYDDKKLPITGFHDNWWTGLELIHTIFHLEHNYIIDNLLIPLVGKKICKAKHGKTVSSTECGDELFEKARMINAALMAKIHTSEWTPALLDNKIFHIAMRANWYGIREVIKGDSPFLRQFLPKKVKHLISGLVGKKTLNLYGKPFSLTEEFVAVYRMHSLIPEKVSLRKITDNKVYKKISVGNMIFRKAQGVMNQLSTDDLLYSFSTSHAGALTLHNYPVFMQKLMAERNTGKKHSDAVSMDMGAVDILRDRERGVPKYNDFRRGIGLPAIENFEKLTNNKKDIEILKDIYDNDIEKVDLLVGGLAENDRYPGFAFGNTAFYIFSVMASRRLMADPFYSDYYTSKYYTKNGINHVESQTMRKVILRHFPRLKDKFYNSDKLVVHNAFRPWRPVFEKVKKELGQ